MLEVVGSTVWRKSALLSAGRILRMNAALDSLFLDLMLQHNNEDKNLIRKYNISLHDLLS